MESVRLRRLIQNPDETMTQSRRALWGGGHRTETSETTFWAFRASFLAPGPAPVWPAAPACTQLSWDTATPGACASAAAFSLEERSWEVVAGTRGPKTRRYLLAI